MGAETCRGTEGAWVAGARLGAADASSLCFASRQHAPRTAGPPSPSPAAPVPPCVAAPLQEPGQKIIDTDTAAQMLALVLPGAPFVEPFCEFLTEQKDYKKSEGGGRPAGRAASPGRQPAGKEGTNCQESAPREGTDCQEAPLLLESREAER